MRHTEIIATDLQVHQSWEVAGREKEYSHKVQRENGLLSNGFLTAYQLQLAERTFSDVVVRLRSTINLTRSINKLPPEILTRCFLYLTPYFHPTLRPHESGHDWIRIIHVCKHWRTVAFNFSQLWDRIEFTRPEILDIYLKSSGSRPLEVCLQRVVDEFRGLVAPRLCGDVMFDLLVPAMSRIHSLTILVYWIPFHNWCRFLEGPLPELETLSITSNVGWGDEGGGRVRWGLGALFQNGLPCLRKLFISECTPWPNNDFKNLTFLCLYNQFALELELLDLLQMLRGSPNLEELYIRQSKRSCWIDDPPSNLGPTFPAHSLRKLRLQNFSNMAIVGILSTIILQPNGVAVDISDTRMTTNTFARIFPLFPPEFSLSSTERLEVYHDSEGLFGIISCGPRGSLRISGSLPLYGEAPHGEEYRTEVAISLFGYIHRECAQTLKELWVHNVQDAGEGYAFDNFSCSNLEKLVLMGGGEVTDRLYAVLDPGNVEIRDLPAPRLRSLAIRRIYNQSQLERLVALCEGRSKMGHPLHEVSVACSSGDVPEWMTRLCGLLPTPIHIGTQKEWDDERMELPMICRDSAGPWWPSWEIWESEVIDTTSQYDSD